MKATTKYTTQRNIMTTAHAIAKTLDKALSYVKRLGQAIKMAWGQIKNIRNFKEFETIAITGKGNFPVTIKIWEEKKINLWVWESETSVKIDDKTFMAKFNQYSNDRIKSIEIGRYYNTNNEIALRCDTSEACNYIFKIEEQRREIRVQFAIDEDFKEMMYNL